MTRSVLLLLGAMGATMGCGSNVNAAGVELVVAPGRPSPRLDAHPTIDRARAAARAVCGREVPIRLELLGTWPAREVAEEAVEELEGVAAALETLAARPTSEPLRAHVRETLVAIVVADVHPPPRAREVHFGADASPRDSREREPDDRGVLRVFRAPMEPNAPHAAAVLSELGRAHSIARARRFASVAPSEVPRDTLPSYVAYLDEAGHEGFWTLERRAPQRRRAPGWRREVLERLLAVHDRLAPDSTPLRVRVDTTTFELASQLLLDPSDDPWGELGARLASFVGARWDAVGDAARLRVLVDVTSTLPEAAPPRRAPYGIALREWIPTLLREIHRNPGAADEMLCASNAPTCVRDRVPRFVALHPPFGPEIVRGLAPSPALLARFFGSALVVPRASSRPELPWAELWRVLDDDSRVVAAWALAEASRTTGRAPHALEAGLAAIYPEATTEVRVELLRLLAQHARPSSENEPSTNGPTNGPTIRAETAELAVLLRHPHGGLDALARVLRFATDDVDVLAIVGTELERFLRGQGDEVEGQAWFRVMEAAVGRFGVRGAKWFGDFLRARPHVEERRLRVQRWLAALERI